MEKIILLYIFGLLNVSLLFGQKDLPVFAQYGECFVNAGKCDDIKIKDELAYIGSEAGLLIFDVSEPDTPDLLGCFYTDKQVFRIFIKDTLAFVTSFNIGPPLVSIVDISDPGNPVLINSFEAAEYGCKSIYVQDNVLFLGLDNGLFVYDIADLLNPEVISHLPDIKPEDMVVKEGYIYVVANYRYFGVIDISTISDPELLCWIGDYTTVRSAIDIYGNYAYVAGNTFDVFDITNPENPNQVCEFETDYLYDISVNENMCISISDDSLIVINIEDAATPVIVDYFAYIGSTLYLDNDLLCVTKDYVDEHPVGIGFFNINELQEISLSSEFTTDKAKDVFVIENYAFVANGFNGLTIINISTPAYPIVVSTCLEDVCVINLFIENGIAYVRTSNGLKIVNVSNPELPNTIGSYFLQPIFSPEVRYSIEKYGNYIYLGGDWLNEIYVIDVSDPGNPVYAGQFGVNDWSTDLDIFDGKLYVAGYWGGMQIFDLSDPVYPQPIGYHFLGLAMQITVGENMAFVGGVYNQGSGGVEIFDVSDPSMPIHSGTYETGGTDMQCVDEYLFVGTREYQDINSSIHIVKMTDLNNPVLEQKVLNVKPNGIYYENERIYVAEDFKFKIFGDSLTVDNPDMSYEDFDIAFSSYPNPATNSVTIEFEVKERDFIQLAVYNNTGMIEEKLIADYFEQGSYTIDWECRNNSGNTLATGIYIIKLSTSQFSVSKKQLILGD